uniref:Uncharacterized protein n=1 Tax=Meloidogyne enterolobii TaxID=390850 RepID=A0A6V7VZ88_MELEN|nr:unnamed protein product [Meloidogyne enterolobii]
MCRKPLIFAQCSFYFNLFFKIETTSRIIMGFVKKGFLAAFLETKNILKILVIR